MKKNTDFFRCFSINLHKFLKVSGIQSMNDGVHTDGIVIKRPDGDDGDRQSFPNLFEANKQTGIPLSRLQVMHQKLMAQNERTIVDEDGYEYSKRVRKFWVYLMTPELAKALRKWNETKPKS